MVFTRNCNAWRAKTAAVRLTGSAGASLRTRAKPDVAATLFPSPDGDVFSNSGGSQHGTGRLQARRPGRNVLRALWKAARSRCGSCRRARTHAHTADEG